MDQQYWDQFYSSEEVTFKASDFAIYCQEKIDETFGTLIDVGCGNGRDTIFFCKNNIDCIGVDQSNEAIELNRSKYKDIRFVRDNFTSMDYSNLTNNHISIYSRFTLHALNYLEEKSFFKSILKNKKLKYLMIETRSINDALYGEGEKVGEHEFITSHYRRFIDPEIIKKTISVNFKILSFEENTGFSKTQNDDPCLIRIIAIKK